MTLREREMGKREDRSTAVFFYGKVRGKVVLCSNLKSILFG